MLRRRLSKIAFLSVLVALVSLFIVFYRIQERRKEELELPRAFEGAVVNHFILTNKYGRVIEKSVLSRDSLTILFIFNQKCPSCEHNINFWKKIDTDFKKEIKCYGIIFSEEVDLPAFAESKKIKFDLFFPVDQEKLKEEFNIEYNLSQTIVLSFGKILFSIAGDIGTNNYFKIKKIIKEKLGK